jgi:hypothetical protein
MNKRTLLLVTWIVWLSLGVFSPVFAGPAPGNAAPVGAYDGGSNRYLIAYLNVETSGSSIFVQLVDQDGATIASAVSVVSSSFLLSRPWIALDDVNARYLVVWQQSNGSDTDIYGQFVNTNGLLLKRDGTNGSDNFVICNNSFAQENPVLAFDRLNERYLVAWEDRRNGTIYPDLYGQLVNADGSLVDQDGNLIPDPDLDNFIISDAANSQSDLSLACDSVNSRFIAVWRDDRFNASNQVEIYAALISPDGSILKADFPVADSTGSHKYKPRVSFDMNANRFLVVWDDWQNAMTPGEIYGQLINADGSIFDRDGNGLGEASIDHFNISNDIAREPNESGVVYESGSGTFLVVWMIRSAGGVPRDLYGQRVNPDGTLNGSQLEIVISANIDESTAYPVYNTSCENSLVTFEVTDTPANIHDISFVPVGDCRSQALDDQQTAGSGSGGGGGCFISVMGY